VLTDDERDPGLMMIVALASCVPPLQMDMFVHEEWCKQPWELHVHTEQDEAKLALRDDSRALFDRCAVALLARLLALTYSLAHSLTYSLTHSLRARSSTDAPSPDTLTCLLTR
jgi:hypothetical protein